MTFNWYGFAWNDSRWPLRFLGNNFSQLLPQRICSPFFFLFCSSCVLFLYIFNSPLSPCCIAHHNKCEASLILSLVPSTKFSNVLMLKLVALHLPGDKMTFNDVRYWRENDTAVGAWKTSVVLGRQSSNWDKRLFQLVWLSICLLVRGKGYTQRHSNFATFVCDIDEANWLFVLDVAVPFQCP